MENKTDKKIILMMALSLIVSLCALVISVASLLFAGNAISKELPISKKYDRGQSLSKAFAHKKPVIALFYTDWCGYCQKFAPMFEKVSKSEELLKNFSVAYVNADKKENRELLYDYNIEGFPSVVLINPSSGKMRQIDNYKLFSQDPLNAIIKEASSFLN